MGRLTASAIIDLGLDITGNSRLQSLALQWLNLVLHEAASEYRFPELEKQYPYSIAAGIDTVPYPTNYAFLVRDRISRAEGRFVLAGSAPSPVRMTSLGNTRDHAGHLDTSCGTPNAVADDRANSQFIIHPIPDEGGMLYLNYQENPAAVGMDDYPWHPSDTALVEAIGFYAERRQRGKQLQVNAALKEAAKRLALGAPSRAQLWVGGPGSGLGSEFK